MLNIFMNVPVFYFNDFKLVYVAIRFLLVCYFDIVKFRYPIVCFNQHCLVAAPTKMIANSRVLSLSHAVPMLFLLAMYVIGISLIPISMQEHSVLVWIVLKGSATNGASTLASTRYGR